MSLKDTLMQFPLTEQKTHRMFEFEHTGLSVIARTIVFGMEYDAILREKPQVDEKIESRMDMIEAQAKEMCAKHHIPYDTPTALDHGKGGVVLQLNDDYVIRLQLGKMNMRNPSPHVLQPTAAHYMPDENISIEILPKLDTKSVTDDDISRKFREAAKDGIHLWDQVKSNIGFDKQGNLLILDPDSYSVKAKPKF